MQMILQKVVLVKDAILQFMQNFMNLHIESLLLLKMQFIRQYGTCIQIKKKKAYTCAQCHTPTDLELLNNLKEDKPALPKKNDVQVHEAISCAYCHKIKDIEEHEKMNKNLLTLKDKVFILQMKIIEIKK